MLTKNVNRIDMHDIYGTRVLYRLGISLLFKFVNIKLMLRKWKNAIRYWKGLIQKDHFCTHISVYNLTSSYIPYYIPAVKFNPLSLYDIRHICI